MGIPQVVHRHVDVGGVKVFYREVGPRGAPTLLLLHGFPSASHQFRRLMDALGDRFHLVAPDYPGFGFSDAPAPKSAGGSFTYSFDALADVMEGFCKAIGLDHFAMYLFDFGAPVGLRLAERHPKWITGLVVQNGNAYVEGLSPMARDFVALRRGIPGAEDKVQQLLTLEVTRSQYLGGAARPELIPPEGWTLDQHFLDLPDRKAIQVDLALDYHTNVARYPAWQAWMREHQPPTLVIWGKNDPFFTEAGARAFQRDLPKAAVHLFESGHFALEERLPEMALLISDFLERMR